MRTALLAVTTTAFAVACTDQPAADLTELVDGPRPTDAFCVEALDRVDAFMATLDSAPGPGEGGTVVLATSGDPIDLMALTSNSYEAHQHQSFVNLMTLVRLDEDLEPEPYLARSWEWNADGTELTFHLRDDVVWHDGTPTTAHDVEFTYLRAVDENTGFANPAYFQNYEGVELVDEYTIRFTVRPHAMPLDTWRAVPIMPVHLLGDVPAGELASHPYGTVCPVGNGPFRFESHRPNESWRFAANPAFPADLGGRPSADNYVVRVIPDPSTLLTSLRNGEIDIYQQVLADHAATIEEVAGLELHSFPGRDYTFIAWNARREMFSDPDVRRALTMAIDRSGMVDALLSGRGAVVNSGVTRVHWAYDPALASALPYDPAGARALLEASGWQDRDGDGTVENSAGEPLRFEIKVNSESAMRRNAAEVVQSQLAAIGVEVAVASSDFGSWVGDITAEDRPFDATMVLYNADFRVDDRDMFHSGAHAEAYAFSGTDSMVLDDLIDTLQTIVDRESAIPLWHRYQAEVVAEQPYTYLFSSDRIAGVSDRVEGVHMDARGEWSGIHDWTIPADRRKYVSSVAR